MTTIWKLQYRGGIINWFLYAGAYIFWKVRIFRQMERESGKKCVCVSLNWISIFICVLARAVGCAYLFFIICGHARKSKKSVHKKPINCTRCMEWFCLRIQCDFIVRAWLYVYHKLFLIIIIIANTKRTITHERERDLLS